MARSHMSGQGGRTMSERFRSWDNYREGEGNLRARQALYDYRRPQIDLQGTVVDRITLPPKRIVDVGCGNGMYLTRLREAFPEAEVIGVDRSPGMIAGLSEPAVVADVRALPFADASADVVLAMHMLYHVPDLQAALDQLGRVLAPGGVLFVSTLASDDRPEYHRIWREAAKRALGAEVGSPSRMVLDHFSLETAQAMLTERFASVRLHDFPGVLEVPEPAPLLDAYRSAESFMAMEPGDFDRVMRQVEADLDRHFATEDLLRVTVHTGILECRGHR